MDTLFSKFKLEIHHPTHFSVFFKSVNGFFKRFTGFFSLNKEERLQAGIFLYGEDHEK